MKICFASDVNYPNYTKRIQQATLKCFLDKKLYEYDFSYYISTNRPEDLIKYNNLNNVKVFGIEELRKGHEYSINYELLPENPVGLYPARYPWNLRRFVVEQAAKDGFDYIIYVDADTILHENMTPEEIVNDIIRKYEPNTVKSNAAIFKYSKDSTSEVFHLHEKYFNLIDKKFNDEDLDTLDGPCMVFIGENNESILKLVQTWHSFTEFGYKKEHGFGYDSNMHGNLSFTIPISGFKVKSESYPFYPNHIFEDRYTHSYIETIPESTENLLSENKTEIFSKKENVFSNNKIENPVVDNDILLLFSKYSCDKVVSGYHNEYNKILPKFKNQTINLLEVGVGTILTTPLEGMSSVPSSMKGWKDSNPEYFPGASLKAFSEYFKNGKIYGVDIQPDCKINEDRIETFIFDSTNSEKCTQILNDLKFDIIIDDGNHDPNFQIKTLENLYNRLNDEGYYIIENVINYEFINYYLSKNEYNYYFNNTNLAVIKKSEKSISNFDDVELESEINISVTQETNVVSSPIVLNENFKFKILGYPFANQGYYINLDKSKERRHHAENLIYKFDISGIDRFSALTDEMIQYSCTKSHLEIFKNSLNNDYEVIFVAEDDFEIYDECQFNTGKKLFSECIKDIYEDTLKVEWDVILFGCNPKTHLIPVTKNLAVISKSTGAWAYLIKKPAYEFLIKNLNYKRDYIAIDDYLPILNDYGFKTLTTIPLTINHAVGFESTLQPRGPVNYDGWINGSYQKYLYDNYPSLNFEDSRLEKEVTIVVVGHFIENYLFYLRYLLHSLPNKLTKCKFIINYDEGYSKDVNSELIRLSAFFRDERADLNVSTSYSFGGLISSIKNVLEKITTPYFIFLEHDWVFLEKDRINFDGLLNTFINHNFVNAVWFNKDDNQMRGFEIATDINNQVVPFGPENRIRESDLIVSCRWSNNPAMFRTDKFKYWFETMINNEHVGKVNQGSHNVEENMITTYREIISKNNWDSIKDDWGTFLYGKIGDSAYVGHTDASKRYLGHNRSEPEINGENYIKNNPL